MDKEKLRAALDKAKVFPVIADYIIWQLSNMPGNEELAEKTAEEIISGKIKIKGVIQNVVSMAAKAKSDNIALLTDAEVFRIIREGLHIGGVVSDEQAAFSPNGNAVVPVNIPAPEAVDAAGAPGVSFDFDDLFD